MGEEDCNPSSLTNSSDFTAEEQELLQLRCGIHIDDSTNICDKHQLKFRKLFELQTKCCDPFRILWN